MSARALFVACAIAALGGGCGVSGRHVAEDEAALLGIHAAVLQAHLDGDPEGWTALETDTVLVGSRGEVFVSDRAQRLERRRAYLGATRFSRYEDLQPPIVKVAPDRSMGWVVAQVGYAGSQVNAVGGEDSVGGTWAWIETYERVNGRWRMSGNVSTRKP